MTIKSLIIKIIMLQFKLKLKLILKTNSDWYLLILRMWKFYF